MASTIGASKPARNPKTVKFIPSKRTAPPSVASQMKPSRDRITSRTRLLGKPSRVLQ